MISIRAGLLFLVLALTTACLSADDQFERVLFPLVLTDHSGAYGTVWSTEFDIRNEADIALEIFASECAFRCDHRCVILVCEPGTATPAHSSFARLHGLRRQVGAVANPASLLYVPADYGPHVVTSLRLIEKSGVLGFGVEVPVVRESQLATQSLWLLDVPFTESARTHLRVYGVESPDGSGRVLVRVLENELEIASGIVDLGSDETPVVGNFDADAPSYRFLNLSGALGAGKSGRGRIHLQALTPGLKFWAMVSVTDNTTQQVTIVSPQ